MRKRLLLSGRVQGVWFRESCREQGLANGVAGWVRNLSDGRVEVVAEGPREACERLLAALRSGATPGYVRQVTERFSAARADTTGFVER